MSINALVPSFSILCVDDSKDNCELFDFALTQAGYAVKSAQSIEEALQLIKDNVFALYLVDISLRDGTGFDLLTTIREVDPLVPVIFCSGDGRDTAQQQAMQAGAHAFFTKPIDFDLLIATIAQLLPT